MFSSLSEDDNHITSDVGTDEIPPFALDHSDSEGLNIATEPSDSQQLCHEDSHTILSGSACDSVRSGYLCSGLMATSASLSTLAPADQMASTDASHQSKPQDCTGLQGDEIVPAGNEKEQESRHSLLDLTGMDFSALASAASGLSLSGYFSGVQSSAGSSSLAESPWRDATMDSDLIVPSVAGSSVGDDGQSSLLLSSQSDLDLSRALRQTVEDGDIVMVDQVSARTASSQHPPHARRKRPHLGKSKLDTVAEEGDSDEHDVGVGPGDVAPHESETVTGRLRSAWNALTPSESTTSRPSWLPRMEKLGRFIPNSRLQENSTAWTPIGGSNMQPEAFEVDAPFRPTGSDPNPRRMSSRIVGRGLESTHSIFRVQSQCTGLDTFSVSTSIPGPCTVRDAIDVVANPELLPCWMASVRGIVAATNVVDSEIRSSADDREYDGEWMEAVTSSGLRTPSSVLNCWYGAWETVCTTVGFPSHVTVGMFVERARGQVGLTVGPFPGGSTEEHTISVRPTSDGVLLVDSVRLTVDEESVEMCRWCAPSLQAHMQQAASSVAILRRLILSGDGVATLENNELPERAPLISSTMERIVSRDSEPSTPLLV